MLTLFSILYLAKISNSQINNQPLIWTASAMEEIERDEKSPVNNHNSEQMKSIQLMAAKGEYEAFQIVIQAPPENLNNVNVVVSDLKNSAGAVIGSENITLYREHYIKLDRPSYQRWSANPTRGKGWYADGLIPFVDPDTGNEIEGAELDAVPFNLAAGVNQPIWVDIFVPRATAFGEYRGTFTVESDRGTTEGNINLTIWNFELPVQPSLNSFFDIWEDRGIEAQTLLLQHKLMSSQRVKYANQEEAFEKLGVKSVRLPFWSGANYNTCKMDPAPSVAELAKAAAQYPSSFLTYVFSVDEIDECQGIKPTLKQWAKNIQQAGLKHLVVMKPQPELYDWVDIWVVNPQMYDEARSEIAEVKQQGDEVWFYTGYSTDYSPLWHLDFPPINFRIPQGWIAQSLGLKGVLLSRTDTWTENPWQEVPIYVQGNTDYPGIEMLFYPGDKVGLNQVVPSIRLKRIREGIEDYEYTEILKKLGYQNWALTIVREVGKDWKNWTKNPDTLYDARQKLGEKIAQLSFEV
ncbi:MAG: glycoside hydrolase domain-containing protein [Pleurocapsa sp.]